MLEQFLTIGLAQAAPAAAPRATQATGPLATVYYVLLVVAVIVALVFTAVVFATGKGDASGGGGAIRTTFRGKASFDDRIFKMLIIMGGFFMLSMLTLDAIAHRLFR